MIIVRHLEDHQLQTKLYFDAEYLPVPKGEYVAWCDGMGTGRCLAKSLHRAANHVFKLHAAFSLAKSTAEGIRCYPVMDGVYITAPSRDSIREALRTAFCELGREFISGHGTSHMFMMRGGLAFGPVLHGDDVEEEAFYGKLRGGGAVSQEEFRASPLYQARSQVLLSPAMVLAYNAEKLAPPFGIYVDDSAKSYPVLVHEDAGFISNLYQWWPGHEDAEEVASLLYDQILFYLTKSLTHSVGIGYKTESIERHRCLAIEYFGGLKKENDEVQPENSSDKK